MDSADRHGHRNEDALKMREPQIRRHQTQRDLSLRRDRPRARGHRRTAEKNSHHHIHARIIPYARRDNATAQGAEIPNP